MQADSVPFLRRIAFIEGISFLVLLGIAMPLKYFAQIPQAVMVCGWIHGVLFVLLCAALLWTRWPISRMAIVFVAALLPFGTFVIDPHLQRWHEQSRIRS